MEFDRVIAVSNTSTVYRDGKRCVKVFASGTPASAVLREARALSCAHECGIRVPPLFEVTEIGGRWAMITEYIPGKTLARLMEEAPMHRTEYLTQLAELQFDIHSHTLPLAEWRAENGECGGERNGKRLGAACHRQLTPFHVIVDRYGKGWTVGWKGLASGDPIADVRESLRCLTRDFGEDAAREYGMLYAAQSRSPITDRLSVQPGGEDASEGGRRVLVRVCIGSACHLKETRRVVEGLQGLIAKNRLFDRVMLRGSPCMGYCGEGICVMVDQERYSLSPQDTETFFRDAVMTRIR